MRALILITPVLVAAAVLLAGGDAAAQGKSKSIEMKLDDGVWDPKGKKFKEAEDPDDLQIPEESMEKPEKGAKKKGVSDDDIDPVTPEADDSTPLPPRPGKQPESQKDAKAEKDAGGAASAEAGDGGAGPDATLVADDQKKAATAKDQQKDEPFKAELLVVPAESSVDIYTQWEKRRKALQARDFTAADAALKAILRIRLDTGTPNLFGISSALTAESRHAMKARDWGMATALAKAAVEVAPDCAAAHLHLGWLAFSQNRSDLVPAFRHVGDAFNAAMGDPPTRVMLIANAVIVLGGGVLLALALLVVVLLLRYARLVVHDLAHLFPRGAPPVFTGAIMTCFLFLPVALGAGLIPVFLFWIAAVWLYATRRERTLLGVALVALAALPFTYSSLAVLLDQGESDATAIYRVLRDGDARADVEAVIAEAKGGSRDSLKLTAAGLWLKRAGRYADAEALYKAAESVSPRDPVALVNLGNLHLVQDRFDLALTAYNAALAADPQYALAHYNLSKLFFRRGDLDKGHRERQEAMRFDPKLVEALSARESPSINRFVADAEPDGDLILERFLEKGSPRRVLIAGLLERRSLGDFSRGDVPYFVAGAIALLVLLNLVRRRIHPSLYCARCGRPACAHCNPENTSADHCGQCFHVYVRKDVPDPKQRNLKEFEVRRHAATAAMLTRAAALVVPGCGQILRGAPGWGVAVMALCGVGFLFVLMRGGPMPGGTSDLNSFRTVIEYGAGGLALAVYGLAVRATFRHTA